MGSGTIVSKFKVKIKRNGDLFVENVMNLSYNKRIAWYQVRASRDPEDKQQET